MTDGDLIRKSVEREFAVTVFIVRGISLGKSLTVVNTSQAPVQKGLKTIDFKLCIQISNRMLNKNVPAFFLTMNDSFLLQ